MSQAPTFPKLKPKSQRCDPHCLGIMLNVETERIERCDECARFKDDRQAARFVIHHMQSKRGGGLRRAHLVAAMDTLEMWGQDQSLPPCTCNEFETCPTCTSR